jgi:co-chaperonin GroES (HSP10)
MCGQAGQQPEYEVNPLLGFKPARGLAWLRKVETEETYRGGRLIIPDQARDKVAKQQFIVVALGDYEFCGADSWEDCPLAHHTKRGEHRHRLQVGDWVVARNRSWGDTLDPNVYDIRVEYILGVFQED